MTTSERFDPASRDRFFHTMVLMGGALALGCGGVSVHDPPAGAGADDLEASAGMGGSAGSAPGAAGVGGAAAAGSGPAGLAGSAGSVSPRACPDEQYTCTGFSCDSDLWSEQGRCYCDPSLPATPAECDAGTTFVCRPTATDPHTGVPLVQPGRVDCRCVPAGKSCSDNCRDAYTEIADGYRCDAAPESGDILCGCSFIFLK
jgi:hypothetical protein